MESSKPSFWQSLQAMLLRLSISSGQPTNEANSSPLVPKTSLKPVFRLDDNDGTFLVIFKTAAARRHWATKLNAEEFSSLSSSIGIELINCPLDEETLNALRASDDVEAIEESPMIRTFQLADTMTQSNPASQVTGQDV